MSLLNDASLVLIPSGYKEDKVYSIIPSDGSGDLDFIRGSDGTRINSLGQVENVCWNLNIYSQDYTNAAWDKLDIVTSSYSNVVISPDGTLSASKLIPNTTASSYHGLQLSSGRPSLTGGVVYTYSVYAKAQGYTKIRLQNYSEGVRAQFDLSNGTLINQNGTTSTFINSMGNGWYRIGFTYTQSTTQSSYWNILVVSTNDNGGVAPVSFSGNGTDAIAIWGAQLNVGSTAKPYFPTTDRLNVPRLTYENGCPSLLLEKQSTNVVTYSEDFSNAVWDKVGTTLSANASISPDGTQNADRFYETATNGSHGFYQNLNISTGTDYTFSCYVKKGNRRYCGLQMYYDIAKGAIAFFDLDNGTLVYEFYEYPGYLVKNSKITSIGNDWYRLEATIRVGISDSYFGLAMASSLWSTGTSYDNTYTGDTSKYIDVWGFQIEQSSYGTSYIPTTSTAVTRLADECYKTSIGSIIGSEFTVFFDGYESIGGDYNRYMILKGGGSTYQNFISLEANPANKIAAIVNDSSGTNVFGSTSNSLTNGERIKMAVKCKNNDFAFFINGSLVSGILSGTVPTVTDLYLGYYTDYADNYNKVNQFILFNRGLTNTELAQLTTI